MSNKTLDDLKNDEGAILEINGEETAVYKDSKGNITKLSPVCTHLGCTVEWNNKDKTWDCPCHGSKFSKEGKVIQGPAIKALEQT